jgi:hypothetical protein
MADGRVFDSAKHTTAGMPDPYELDLEQVQDMVADAARRRTPVSFHLSVAEFEWTDGSRAWAIPLDWDPCDAWIIRNIGKHLPAPVREVCEEVAMHAETIDPVINYAIHFGQAFREVVQ